MIRHVLCGLAAAVILAAGCGEKPKPTPDGKETDPKKIEKNESK